MRYHRFVSKCIISIKWCITIIIEKSFIQCGYFNILFVIRENKNLRINILSEFLNHIYKVPVHPRWSLNPAAHRQIVRKQFVQGRYTWQKLYDDLATESSTRDLRVAGFRMVYLHLTLAYYKGQGQGNANFDCKYLINSDR